MQAPDYEFMSNDESDDHDGAQRQQQHSMSASLMRPKPGEGSAAAQPADVAVPAVRSSMQAVALSHTAHAAAGVEATQSDPGNAAVQQQENAAAADLAETNNSRNCEGHRAQPEASAPADFHDSAAAVSDSMLSTEAVLDRSNTENIVPAKSAHLACEPVLQELPPCQASPEQCAVEENRLQAKAASADCQQALPKHAKQAGTVHNATLTAEQQPCIRLEPVTDDNEGVSSASSGQHRPDSMQAAQGGTAAAAAHVAERTAQQGGHIGSQQLAHDSTAYPAAGSIQPGLGTEQAGQSDNVKAAAVQDMPQYSEQKACIEPQQLQQQQQQQACGSKGNEHAPSGCQSQDHASAELSQHSMPAVANGDQSCLPDALCGSAIIPDSEEPEYALPVAAVSQQQSEVKCAVLSATDQTVVRADADSEGQALALSDQQQGITGDPTKCRSTTGTDADSSKRCTLPGDIACWDNLSRLACFCLPCG